MLCALDGDDAKEGTLRLLRGALNPQDYPVLNITLSARCIRLGPWHARKDATAGSAKADRVLRDHSADAVMWGEVPKQDDSLRFFLRGAGRQETQTILFDKGLAKERPDDALGVVLTAVALSQIVPATEEAGRYLVFRLRPVAVRLEALLSEPRLVPAPASGSLQHALGLAFKVTGEQSGDNLVLEKAIAAFRGALQVWTRERVPLDWASDPEQPRQRAFRRSGERESGTARLEEAVAAYRAALQERTRERVPLDWAMTQNNLGTALRTLGRARERHGAAGGGGRRLPRGAAGMDARAGAARLGDDAEQPRQRAFDARANARAARRGWRRRSPPTARRCRNGRASACRCDWATTQNNLGNALRRLGERESGTARLEEAVAAYRAALQERTRERVPLDWAMTQNNLGNALQTLGERESGTARLEEAVAAYRAALQECTRERVPLDWAMTQNNLGNALWTLGERESGTARLEEAVAAYRAALRGTHARARAARLGDDAEQPRHRACDARRARERHGAARRGGRRLPRGAAGTDARARAARLGDDAEQPRQRAFARSASARAAQRG